MQAQDKQDRAFITDVVYGTLRHLIYLDACLKPYLKHPERLPDAILSILQAGTYEKLIRQSASHALVSEWVEVSKLQHPKLSGLANAVLRKVSPPVLTPALSASTPGWLYQHWQELFSNDTALDIGRAMLQAEPLWLSVCHPDAKISLEQEGCDVSEGPLPQSLAVRPAKPLAALEAFRKGWVQPQNPSSRLPVMLLSPKAGERILDLAAGNGIKAAQLAQAGATTISVELDAHKIAAAQQNLVRLGLHAEHLQHDLRTLPNLAAAPKVLLDAPCSGTGTLRGHPEIKLRLKPADIEHLAKLQAQLLQTAASLTESGGQLVYSVCSLTEAEGPAQIRKLLQQNPQFHLESFVSQLPQHNTDAGSFILPLGGLDGFFIASLRKAG